MSSYILNQLKLSKSETVALFRILDGQIDLDTTSKLYEKLYTHYSSDGTMPYNVQTGDDDPGNWVTERLTYDLGQFVLDTGLRN